MSLTVLTLEPSERTLSTDCDDRMERAPPEGYNDVTVGHTCNDFGSTESPLRPTPHPMSADTHWYKDGLRFECTQCGNCCSGFPGFVWVNDDELRAIAEHTGKSIGEIRLMHTRLYAGRLSLSEFANGDCTFFDPRTRGCSIYEARPTQCRTWPFWRSNIESPEAWARASQSCPGINRGDFIPLEEIETRVSQRDI